MLRLGAERRRHEILFIHTEASDPKVAELLTRMMGPKVVVVPGLAKSRPRS